MQPKKNWKYYPAPQRLSSKKKTNWPAIVFCIALLAALLLVAKFVCASPVERAILHIVQTGVPTHQVRPWPAHPIAHNVRARQTVVEAIEGASAAHSVPWEYLVAIGFRESSFHPDAVGNIGEGSMFQLVPGVVRRAARLDGRCSLETIRGSAHCAAAWLNHWRQKCGSMQGALSIYANGRSCEPQSSRVRWIVQDRMDLAKYLGQLSDPSI